MPLYEYECPNCGAKIEVLQKLGENGEQLVCQDCSQVGLRKVISCCASTVTGFSGSSSGASGCPAGGSGFA